MRNAQLARRQYHFWIINTTAKYAAWINNFRNIMTEIVERELLICNFNHPLESYFYSLHLQSGSFFVHDRFFLLDVLDFFKNLEKFKIFFNYITLFYYNTLLNRYYKFKEGTGLLFHFGEIWEWYFACTKKFQRIDCVSWMT